MSRREREYILSWGGGVNSTAILAMIKLGMLPEYTKENSHIVFGDTGAEMPYTYEHTNTILSEMVKEGWTAKSLSPLTYQDYYSPRCKDKPLPQFCLEHYIIPSRINRWCTQEYKTKPLKRYAKENNLNIMVLGISYEEKHRAKALYSDTTDYPLIRHKIDRDGCIELTKKAGLPEARKSGCYFCPYQRKAGWLDLYKNYPELFKEAESIEINARTRYDGKSYFLIRDLPIREQIKKWLKKEKEKCKQQEFETFGLDQHCFCAD